MSKRLMLMNMILVGLLAGCANLHARSLSHAWGQWNHGAKESAVALAGAEFERYLRANDLSATRVEKTASNASLRLEETLIVDGLKTKQPDPVELLQQGPSALTIELRQDLGSDDSLRVMRALHTVQSLGLREHALSIFAIIYRRQPYADRRAFFGQASPALRSVSVKWAALKTLRGFLPTGSSTVLPTLE